jgi:transcriptional regulator with XRE-family HTH domain
MRLDIEEIRLLRCLCSLRGMSQREVARRLGVTEALVSMWRHGRRKPGQVRMDALRQLYLDTRSEDERRSDERREKFLQILRAAAQPD